MPESSKYAELCFYAKEIRAEKNESHKLSTAVSAMKEGKMSQ